MAEPITVRDYTPDDYPMLESWWKTRNAHPVPPDWFPPDAYIAERDGEALAFCVFYLTFGVGFALVDWPVTAPGLKAGLSILAGKALNAEFDRRHGGSYTHVRGMCRSDMRNAARRLGYTVANSSSFEMVRRVS